MITQDNYFSVIFGEGSAAVDIGQLVDGITNIDRGVGSGWLNTYSANSGRYGQTWLYGKIDMKPISIDFVIYGDQKRMARARTEIGAALDKFRGTPQKLRFNDEPDRYYTAVVDGKVSFKENITKTEGRGTINFVVSDGLAHSITTKKVVMGQNGPSGYIENVSDGGYVHIHVNNTGSVEAFPKIKIKNNADNGWYGLVNSTGVMELGYKKANETGASVGLGGVKSETLLSIKKGDNTTTTGWGRFVDASGIITTSPISSNVLIDGTLTPKINTDGFATNGMSYDNNSGVTNLAYKWTGGAKVFNLPLDSSGAQGATNFRCDFNIKWWANQMGQTGFLSIIFADEMNNVVAAYDIAKEDVQGNTATFKMWLEANVYRETINFESNNAEANQTSKNEAFNSNAGNAFVIKEGPVITFGYGNKKITKREAKSEFKKCAKIFIVSGKFNKPNTSAGNVLKMVVESMSFTKHNVNRYDLVPNRYVKNSEVIILNESREIKFNPNAGMLEEPINIAEDLVSGFDFFSIPPGESDIRIHQSEFNDMFPDVEVEWSEQYT